MYLRRLWRAGRLLYPRANEGTLVARPEILSRPAPGFATPGGPKRRSRVVIWGIVVFVVGLLVRLALVLPNRQATRMEQPEPVQIALSLIATGRYADAYGAGSGPTAHCAPLHPVLLSMIFGIFGTGAPGALAMKVCASTAAAVGFALLPALAVAGGLGLSSGVLAGMAGALAPVNFWAQTSGSFDAPFTSVALMALCLLLCRVWAAARFTKSEGVAFGVVAGFGCLLNPALIPVLAAWSIASAVRYRLQLRRVLAFFAVAAILGLSILAPWAIRNYRALGSPIWTRSNFGLELQVSNNDVMTADLERNVRLPEYPLLHPFAGADERAKVRIAGEVAYQRAKERQAFAWIASHKRRFLSLTAERFRLFWLPNMLRPWQSACEAALTLLGLCGLALLLWRRHAFAWVAIAALAAYPAVYYVIQVSARYRFPLEPILFLLTAYLFLDILGSGLAMVSNFIRDRRGSIPVLPTPSSSADRHPCR